VLKFNDVNPSWRQYQEALKKRDACRLQAYKFFKLFLVLSLVAVLCFLIVRYYPRPAARVPVPPPTSTDKQAEVAKKAPYEISRVDLPAALQPGFFHQFSQAEFDLRINDEILRVKTTLDPALQKYMMDITNRDHAQAMGFVAMDPATGRVLAMTGFDAADPSRNPCLENLFPAASIFKIVTAAAAIEEFGFHEETTFKYRGGKYTLYKSQITEAPSNGTPIRFRDAFGGSVNPVFGQLGAVYLKKERIEKYAGVFMFNSPLPFDMPVAVSEFAANDEPFRLAELGSGYNRETRISPFHGAMIVSMIVNDGALPDPYVIEQLTNAKGQAVYAHQSSRRQVIKKHTARIIHHMMNTTIESGTCKKAFRGYKKDATLSKLDIGGKTGSICGDTCATRYDWFAGFAQARQGKKAIVTAAVVAHDKLLGTRSMIYAKNAMRFYFENDQPQSRTPD
jgi:penicillin-binding protein A